MVRPANVPPRPRPAATISDETTGAVIASALGFDPQRIVQVFQVALAYASTQSTAPVNTTTADKAGDGDAGEESASSGPEVLCPPTLSSLPSQPFSWQQVLAAQASSLSGRQPPTDQIRREYAVLGEVAMNAILKALDNQVPLDTTAS